MYPAAYLQTGNDHKIPYRKITSVQNEDRIPSFTGLKSFSFI